MKGEFPAQRATYAENVPGHLLTSSYLHCTAPIENDVMDEQAFARLEPMLTWIGP